MKYLIRDQNVDSEPIAPVEINRRFAAGEIAASAQCRKETEPDRWRPLVETFRHLKFAGARQMPDTSTTPPSVTSVDWHKWNLRLRYCLAVVFAGAAVSLWSMAQREPGDAGGLYGAGALLMLFALLMPFEHTRRIDQEAGTITNEGRWLGQILWCKPRPLSDFVAVVYRRLRVSAVAQGESDAVWVGLQPKSGKFVPMGIFESEGPRGPSCLAVVFAYDLARKTGLKVIPEDIKW